MAILCIISEKVRHLSKIRIFLTPPAFNIPVKGTLLEFCHNSLYGKNWNGGATSKWKIWGYVYSVIQYKNATDVCTETSWQHTLLYTAAHGKKLILLICIVVNNGHNLSVRIPLTDTHFPTQELVHALQQRKTFMECCYAMWQMFLMPSVTQIGLNRKWMC